MKYRNPGYSIAQDTIVSTPNGRIARKAGTEMLQLRPSFGSQLIAGSAETNTASQVHRSNRRFSRLSTRVLICDDHTLFREGIKAILSSDPAIEVVGLS